MGRSRVNRALVAIAIVRMTDCVESCKHLPGYCVMCLLSYIGALHHSCSCQGISAQYWFGVGLFQRYQVVLLFFVIEQGVLLSNKSSATRNRCSKGLQPDRHDSADYCCLVFL